jgi:hypothetical protein
MRCFTDRPDRSARRAPERAGAVEPSGSGGAGDEHRDHTSRRRTTERPAALRSANGGPRYLPGTLPTTPPDAFKMEGSISRLEAPAPQDMTPTYPPPTPAKQPFTRRGVA